MFKKIISIAMSVLLILSIATITFTPATQAGPPTIDSGDYLGWGSSKCSFDNCGTQNCVILMLAICTTGTILWET